MGIFEKSKTGTEVSLKNAQASLKLDLAGGAITDFHLLENGVNPLSFRFSPEQMPQNNRGGAPYQGHFLCLGRWGEPSTGEKEAGMPNHGQFANISWKPEEVQEDRTVVMSAVAPLEGMKVRRRVTLDVETAVFAVGEEITNINPLGRLYNMVQHPTLASPFLDLDTQIECNAELGFDQAFSHIPEKHALEWPNAYMEEGSLLNLRSLGIPYNSVFSFIVNRKDNLGWITAFSPSYQALFGYVWKRQDYPWIHLWQHWTGQQIRYRGIEFGTAGIHKPFREIITTFPKVFGESTFAYIDAGEIVNRRYLSFLLKVKTGYAGVAGIELEEGKIHIRGKQQEQDTTISTTLTAFL